MKLRFLALTLLFALLLSLCPAFGTDTPDFSAQTPDEVMADFMTAHNLDENNCAIGWQDLATGDTWYFNADTYMVAGSMYKLPLNMAITDRLASGELEPTDLTRGYQIQVAMERSIVYSDNECAQALRYALSDDRDTYRNILAQYSGIPVEELPDSYYSENRMSPRFLLNTLVHLYTHAEDYADLLEDLKIAHPDRYFQSTRTDYEIAHKYGSFEGALNDCGIVYTPRPFALVALFKGGAATEENLGALCALMTDYALYLDTLPAPAPEPTPTPESAPVMTVATPSPTPEHVQTASAVPGKTAVRNTIIVILAAAVLLVLPALLIRKGHKLPAVLLIAATVLAVAAAVLFLPRSTDKTPVETPSPSPTEVPESTPSVPPTETTWTLSFAGDCTIGTVHEWQNYQNDANMLYVMDGDYAYPFSNVAQLFQNDDFTLVNLEGAFTDETRAKGKEYRFRSGPENAEVLTLGGVDAVTLANNHSGDYREQGLADTKAALDTRDILWTDEATPLIAELPDGLKLGIIAFNCVEIDLNVGDVTGYMERITPLYEQCEDADCDLILAYLHWGWEYRYTPETWMVTLAHDLADLGCDLVIGSHAHVLQPVETYNGVPIFYGLGNFCYGGNNDPDDKDTVIIQQEIRRVGDEVSLGETRYLPCCISSTDSVNDFRPTLYAETDEGYQRVMEKLGFHN